MKHEYNKASAGAGGTKAWIKCFDVTKDLRLLALGIINCHLLWSLLNFLDKKMKDEYFMVIRYFLTMSNRY